MQPEPHPFISLCLLVNIEQHPSEFNPGFVKVSIKVSKLSSTQVCKSEYKRSKKCGGTVPLASPEGFGI